MINLINLFIRVFLTGSLTIIVLTLVFNINTKFASDLSNKNEISQNLFVGFKTVFNL